MVYYDYGDTAVGKMTRYETVQIRILRIGDYKDTAYERSETKNGRNAESYLADGTKARRTADIVPADDFAYHRIEKCKENLSPTTRPLLCSASDKMPDRIHDLSGTIDGYAYFG